MLNPDVFKSKRNNNKFLGFLFCFVKESLASACNQFGHGDILFIVTLLTCSSLILFIRIIPIAMKY